MRQEDARVGMQIVSHSNGFTNGMCGKVKELLRHPTHPDALVVDWETTRDGRPLKVPMTTAVATSLVEPLPFPPVRTPPAVVS